MSDNPYSQKEYDECFDVVKRLVQNQLIRVPELLTEDYFSIMHALLDDIQEDLE